VIEVLIPPLADINMLASDLTPGAESNVIETPYGNIGGLICFDSIYEILTLESVENGAELILLPTNDSWFTDSAALSMHNAQAQLRAIESGRYLARSANTGISGVISPCGEIIKSAGWNKQTSISHSLTLNNNITYYAKYGDWIGRIGLYVAFLGLLYWIAYSTKKRNLLVD
jgi:apolipoprotein N-acyltransferase